jgi:hypothetical protein
MAITDGVRRAISELGKESIETINAVASLAQQELNQELGTNVFVYGANSLTGGANPSATLKKINKDKTERLNRLRKEPVIARIVTESNGGIKEVFYISRAAPICLQDSQAHFASYGSPIGRLASVPVGDDVTINVPGKEKSYLVMERTELHPRFELEWDSYDNVIDSNEYGLHTVSSLLAFLSEGLSSADIEDILSRIVEDESANASIMVGRRRRVIDRMQLRDQPILDQYQDEIFRLSLDSQILITGPPGTGKTTTLIRRLGQKLDQNYFTEEEQDLVKKSVGLNSLPHEQSWVMFSPTELLKLYVKEAFNREGIPAPEERIRTWADERRRLSRNILGILKSGTGGVFTLDDHKAILQQSALTDSITWFGDFQSFFYSDLLSRINDSVDKLSKIQESNVINLINKVKKSLKLSDLIENPENQLAIFGVIISLNQLSGEIDNVLKSYNDELRELIKTWLNKILRNQRDFLNRLALYLDTLKDDPNEDFSDDDEEDDTEDDALVQASSVKLNNAQKGYVAAMRALAKAKLAKRQLPPNTRAAKVVAWLEDNLPEENELSVLGAKLDILTQLRQIANPIQLYLTKIPTRYHTFRRERIKANQWYFNNDNTSSVLRRRSLHGLEVDIIVLLMLRHAGQLLARFPQRDLENNAKYGILRSINSEYRHQVLVDEATDFSPIQLASMLELAHPKIRSFVACGDLHQRITSWGTRDLSQINWVSNRIELRPMSVAYRQSQILTDLAKKIALLSRDAIDHVSLLDRVENEGELPVLAEKLEGYALAKWLGARIVEVEQRVGKLPSIALFVDEEAAVDPLAEALGEILRDNNIQVVSCPKGRVMGQDGDVRVFDVQHIKGLEFEAVFFINVDKLATREIDLFNKFLYVGATRAATYLGLTCENNLPAVMEALRDDFSSDWE